jgi:ATP-binding cassette subfamily B protein
MRPRKDQTKQILAFYGQRVWKYPRKVIGLLLVIPLTVLLNQFLPPIILANVLNRLSTKNFDAHHIWNSFGGDLLAYAALTLFGGVIAWRIVDSLAWRLEGNVEQDIARKVFDHLLSLGADFHANHFGGSLVSQTNKLMGSYIRMADTTIYQVVPLIASLLFATIILAHRAPLFVIILLIFSVFYIVTSFFVTKPVRKLGAEQAATESIQTGYLADAITNIMTIKSFAAKAHENRRFAKATNNTKDSLMALMRGHQRQQIYFSSMASLISAASLTMAVVGVAIFKANLATVFLILNYTASIVGQLFQFSNSALRNYNRSLGDASNMVSILQLNQEVEDSPNPEKLKIRQGIIEFKNVVFGHEGSSEAIFEDFNLTIYPGEKIGLVGHSGSGKTTFARLLLRFSDIRGGEITIDSQNIAAVAQDDLRSAIAYVPQEPLLFHRSIAENIAYGKSGASVAEIEQAAKLANAHGFIKNLPNGYETLVGERGIKLSGGQRQRIAIARAMLKNAPVLALDEATSALDSESEKLIQAALWKLMEGRTAIVIAHRLSTIQRMDRIVVLEEGKIVEQGSHKELIGQNGVYAKLWAHQSGGFLED